MAKLVATFVAFACVGIGVAGCGPPAPPPRINAVLPENLPISGESQDDCEKADAVVLAQCTLRQEYAKTVRGNWECHWYVTSWRVVRVERGHWPDASVDFIFYERWPTPESGILLDIEAGPPVYHRGAMMAFCIDTSQRRPTIVAQEQRSRIPPHGKLRPPPGDFYDRGKRVTYDAVMAAATQSAKRSGSKMPPLRVTEEYDNFYVVELGNTLESEVVTVKKGTYEVQPVEPAYK